MSRKVSSFANYLCCVYCYSRDARELRYTSCRLALLSVLRSWTGTIEFCNPSKPSGLKAIVDTLYLNQMEVRVSNWIQLGDILLHSELVI